MLVGEEVRITPARDEWDGSVNAKARSFGRRRFGPAGDATKAAAAAASGATMQKGDALAPLPNLWVSSSMTLTGLYALLTLMVAQVTGLEPGEFILTFGDVHLYANHMEQADLQLTRQPKPLPTMTLNPDVGDIFGFRFEDFALAGYDADPHIAAPVAV